MNFLLFCWTDLNLTQTEVKEREHSQVEPLVPDWVEVAEDGLRPPFGLSHLDGDIGVAGASFVFRL